MHNGLSETLALLQSSGSSVVPVARDSACEVALLRWENPVVAVCGVVLVAAIVPLFQAGTYWRL